MAQVIYLLRDLQQRLRHCPQTTLQYALVRAARQFCSESRWLRYGLTAPLTPGVRSFSLGTDPLLEIVDVPLASVTLQNGTVYTFGQPCDPTYFDPNLGQGQPLRYAYLQTQAVAFDPIPDLAYTVTLTLACQPRDAVAELPDELLVKWRYALEAGALKFLYDMPGEAWYSELQSEKQGRIFQSNINNAKADVARGFQSGSVRARPRPFVIGGR